MQSPLEMNCVGYQKDGCWDQIFEDGMNTKNADINVPRCIISLYHNSANGFNALELNVWFADLFNRHSLNLQ